MRPKWVLLTACETWTHLSPISTQVCVSRVEPFCPGSSVWLAYSHTCSCGSTQSAIWQLRPAGGTAAKDLSWEDQCSSQVRLQCYFTYKGPEEVLECAFLWRKCHSGIIIISSHCKDSQNWTAVPALQGKRFLLPSATLVLRSLCKQVNIYPHLGINASPPAGSGDPHNVVSISPWLADEPQQWLLMKQWKYRVHHHKSKL